ncbi:hypothetical protein HGG71_02610 [Rhodobacteraceae bacterium R_SAG2]|nr:hypothetical protein [Rhodobacteraceae bacterium R_SAG2]
MFRLLAALTGLAVVGACSAPELSQEAAASMTNIQLCQTYAYAKSFNDAQRLNRVKHELKQRGAVTEQDLSDMAKGVIRTGMKEHVAVCSWGPYRDINTTVVGSYESKQFVLPNYSFFYTRNGRVYAWQD